MTAVPNRHAHNLPSWPSSFIGRERELAEVKRLVISTRLLTLTGAGGCGKTRLAGATADRLAASPLFEHGSWFIDLAGLSDPLAVPQTIAQVLSVPEAHDRKIINSVADFLQHKRCLLILDNCEHLLPACAELAQTLLDADPHLHILATSREPLNVSHETVWLVPSLAVPEAYPPSQLTHPSKSEAIQLFVARASAALPGFVLDESNAAAVVQICRRLDGIPLALELAAARVKLLDVGQIADRVDDNLQLLTRGSRTAPPRHQTMRAALDWSYGLLSMRERVLFQRLAVFAGGFTLEAVEAVCVADAHAPEQPAETEGPYASDALDVLSNLVDKSLVTIADRPPGQAVRYRLLEPIRQYALDRLREAGAETAVRDRHLAYFIDFAEQAERQLKSESQLRWLERLEREHDNMRAALEWSVREARHDSAGLRLAAALHLFWQRRYHWTEANRWLKQVIANYEAHDASHTRSGDLYLARAIVARGWLAVYLQEYGHTRQSLERGLALAQESGDALTAARALGLLSFLDSYAGNVTAASQLAADSVARARQAGDSWLLAWSLHVFGRNYYNLGDEQAARVALAESEALYRKTGDRRSLAVHINNEAIIAENAGELELARQLFEEVLSIGQELADNELQLKAVANLAGLALVQGNISRAEQLYEQVLAQRRALGTQLLAGACLSGLARIRILQGDFEAAEQLLREGLTLSRGTERQGMLALSLAGLSRIYVERGQALQAARIWGAIDPILKRRLDADDRFGLDHWEAALRAALTPEEFEAAFTAGQALTLEQVAQEAMSLAQAGTPDGQQPEPAVTVLRLNALGPARAFLSGQPVTTWPYARVKELLFYLISHPACTKAQLGLALWPDASPKQLRNSLSTTLYHLRRALSNPQWIVFEDDVYRFNRALDYQFDVEVFEANLARASRLQSHAPDRAITLLQETLTLYRGDFVEDLLDGEWFLLRREELRRKYLDALLHLGQTALHAAGLRTRRRVLSPRHREGRSAGRSAPRVDALLCAAGRTRSGAAALSDVRAADPRRTGLSACGRERRALRAPQAW